MSNKLAIRCGRMRNIYIGLAAPCTLIIPFIYLLDQIRPIEDWIVWVIIFVFLAILISTTIWLCLQLWPKAEFNMESNSIRISYKSSGPFVPADFTFSVTDITSFKRKVIFDLFYFELKLGIYGKVIHISPPNYSLEELTKFYEFFFDLEKNLNKVVGEDDFSEAS